MSSQQLLRELYWREHPQGRRQALTAGSGLLCNLHGLWIVADDLHHLIHVPDPRGAGDAVGWRIFPGDLPEEPKARKKAKPDTEALIHLHGDDAIAFPSGSKRHRVRGQRLRLRPGPDVPQGDVDFTGLLHPLEDLIPDLNIEGGVVLGSEVLLLQRGNGQAGHNGLIHLNLKAFTAGLQGRWDFAALNVRVRPMPLPDWNSVPLTFTDAFLWDGVLYFSAAAEGGNSTYLDGEVMGSVIGAVWADGTLLELARFEKIKIEGVAVERDLGQSLQVFAVTDADDPKIPSHLLSVKIPKAL